jgi:hypothetical protein
MLIVVAISLAIGFALGYFYIKPGITAIEDTYRAELETWNLEAAGDEKIWIPIPLNAERKDPRTRPRASRVLV